MKKYLVYEYSNYTDTLRVITPANERIIEEMTEAVNNGDYESFEYKDADLWDIIAYTNVYGVKQIPVDFDELVKAFEAFFDTEMSDLYDPGEVWNNLDIRINGNYDSIDEAVNHDLEDLKHDLRERIEADGYKW